MGDPDPPTNDTRDTRAIEQEARPAGAPPAGKPAGNGESDRNETDGRPTVSASPSSPHSPGIVSWPVDHAGPHPEARPTPDLAGPETWQRLSRITPEFAADALPSLAEDLAALKRARRRRHAVGLLFLAVLAGVLAYAMQQPEGRAILAVAQRRAAVSFGGSPWRDAGATNTPAAPSHLEAESLSALVGPRTRAAAQDDAQEMAGSGARRGGRTSGHSQEADTAMDDEREPAPRLTNKAVGYLYLRTVPAADVYIDGVKLPTRTPLKGYPVAKGRRKLVVKTDDGETRGPFTIIVRPGKKKHIQTIVIRKTRPPR